LGVVTLLRRLRLRLKSLIKSLLGIELLDVKIAKEKELGRELIAYETINLFKEELKKLREGKHSPYFLGVAGAFALEMGMPFSKVLFIVTFLIHAMAESLPVVLSGIPWEGALIKLRGMLTLEQSVGSLFVRRLRMR